VESDRALGNIAIERQCEKDFRWDSLMDKSWNVIESELLVVPRMPYETTAASVHAPQLCYSQIKRVLLRRLPHGRDLSPSRPYES